MKQYLLVAFLMVLLNVGLANQAFAGYCYVTVDSDSTSTNSSLRSKIEKYVNAGDASSCSLIYLDGDEYEYVNDYQIFKLGSDTGDTAQGIIFETPELGGSVRTITLGDQISIGATAPLVIGNHSLETFTDSSNELSEITGVDQFGGSFLVDLGYVDAVTSRSAGTLGALSTSISSYPIGLSLGNDSGLTFYGYYTDPEEDSDTGKLDYSGTYLGVEFKDDWNKTTKTLYNYGTVVIDASGVEDKPFVCQTGSSYVFLRDLVILTSTHEQDDFFADDTESSCLKNGGNVSICSAEGLNQEVYDAWVDGGSTNGADLPSDWCSDNKTFPGIHLNPGDIVFPWLDWPVWYEDSDGDGYGNPESKKRAETQPDGYVENDEDCDDNNIEVHPDATEVCGDDTDNNCDGLTDCEDGSCSSDTACVDSPETDCSDGADNDGDGAFDCDDLDCETNADCTGTGSESACDDDVDNDGDGASDCDDSDCASDAACTAEPETACSDDTDNDGDGDMDCSDTDCYYDAACDDQVETSCTDYIDNDGDSAVDCEDADCEFESVCADTDGDGDGFTLSENDCDDTNDEINPGADEICLDDVDNNCDGVTDETLCIDLQIGTDPTTVSQQLEGGAGCGCYIGSKSNVAPEQSILALLAGLPLVVGFVLRSRASNRDGLSKS